MVYNIWGSWLYSQQGLQEIQFKYFGSLGGGGYILAMAEVESHETVQLNQMIWNSCIVSCDSDSAIGIIPPFPSSDSKYLKWITWNYSKWFDLLLLFHVIPMIMIIKLIWNSPNCMKSFEMVWSDPIQIFRITWGRGVYSGYGWVGITWHSSIESNDLE